MILLWMNASLFRLKDQLKKYIIIEMSLISETIISIEADPRPMVATRIQPGVNCVPKFVLPYASKPHIDAGGSLFCKTL